MERTGIATPARSRWWTRKAAITRLFPRNKDTHWGVDLPWRSLFLLMSRRITWPMRPRERYDFPSVLGSSSAGPNERLAKRFLAPDPHRS